MLGDHLAYLQSCSLLYIFRMFGRLFMVLYGPKITNDQQPPFDFAILNLYYSKKFHYYLMFAVAQSVHDLVFLLFVV